MKWICTALTVFFLAVTHVVAQDLFVTIPAVPTKNPLEGNAEAITAGMGAYRVRCADFHGMDARGIRGPDITQVWAKGRTDAALFSTIHNGVPGTEMPAFPAPRTSDMDVWRILAYLKTMPAPAKTCSSPTVWGATEWANAAGTSDQTSRASASRVRAPPCRGRFAAPSRTSVLATSPSR
jgi:mono/diheme cytochrome c family protein